MFYEFDHKGWCPKILSNGWCEEKVSLIGHVQTTKKYWRENDEACFYQDAGVL